MIQLNTKAFEQTITKIGDAINAGGLRVVNAQALNAKDQLLAAIAKHIDRPRPFTTNANGYQADEPQLIYGAATARFYIKPIQSAYLSYVFFGGVRVPGDPGTSESRMTAATTKTRIRCRSASSKPEPCSRPAPRRPTTARRVSRPGSSSATRSTPRPGRRPRVDKVRSWTCFVSA
jgi:hypothetical protein